MFALRWDPAAMPSQLAIARFSPHTDRVELEIPLLAASHWTEAHASDQLAGFPEFDAGALETMAVITTPPDEDCPWLT